MGPLEGLNIISPELDYILALLIGIAFGFVLEQAGFSSSKRLAGLFYGYDFVVLRVFFTAAITACLGTVLLDYLGLLDMSLVFINPTFLWPQAVGGAIMGLGFILGGFCPGTGICAASIGKIDALIFVGGLFFGVFLFAEAYPLYENFYHSSSLGDITIYDTLGMSKGLFIFLLLLIAILAFVVTFIIEQSITHQPKTKLIHLPKKYPYHTLAILGSIVFTIILISLPDRKTQIINNVNKTLASKHYSVKKISNIELTYNILDDVQTIWLVDVRNEKDFEKLHLPGAVNIPLEKLFDRSWEDYLGNQNLKKIFIGYGNTDATRAALLCKEIGYKNLIILDGGFNEYEAVILKGIHKPSNNNDETNAFISESSVLIKEMIAKSKLPKVKPKVIMKAKGGC